MDQRANFIELQRCLIWTFMVQMSKEFSISYCFWPQLDITYLQSFFYLLWDFCGIDPNSICLWNTKTIDSSWWTLNKTFFESDCFYNKIRDLINVKQRDQMIRLLFPNLAMLITKILPNRIRNLPKLDKKLSNTK